MNISCSLIDNKNEWLKRYYAETLTPFKILTKVVGPLILIFLDKDYKCAQRLIYIYKLFVSEKISRIKCRKTPKMVQNFRIHFF